MEVAEEYFPCLVLKFFFNDEVWKHLKMSRLRTIDREPKSNHGFFNTVTDSEYDKNGILEITFHLISLILELPMMKIFTLLFESKNSSIHILYKMILTEICGIWSRITKKLLIVFLIMCNSFRITP